MEIDTYISFWFRTILARLLLLSQIPVFGRSSKSFTSLPGTEPGPAKFGRRRGLTSAAECAVHRIRIYKPLGRENGIAASLASSRETFHRLIAHQCLRFGNATYERSMILTLLFSTI